MNKIEFKQLWNRRRTNITMCIELFLVFMLVWYIVDFLFVVGYTYRIPSHWNMEHTLKIVVDRYPETVPEYQEEDEEEAILNFDRLYRFIGSYPGIKKITYAKERFYPASGSSSLWRYTNAEDTTRRGGGETVDFPPVGDYFGVFGFSTRDGKNISVDDFQRDPRKVIITENMAQHLFPGQEAVGKKIFRNDDRQTEFIVQKVIGNIKRYNDMRPGYYLFVPVEMDYTFNREELMSFAIRIDENLNEEQFIEELSGHLFSNLNIGNYFLKQIKPFTIDFEEGESDTVSDVRIRVILMLFFLICIFLCLIGSFWFNVSKRKSEIGLKMSLGATPVVIRKQFITEALLLLTFSAILAMLVEVNIVRADLLDTPGTGWGVADAVYFPDKTWLRFMTTNLLTWIIMAVITVLSVWFPAKAASSINPVEALRDE